MSLKWPSALVNHNNRLKTWPKNKVPPDCGIFWWKLMVKCSHADLVVSIVVIFVVTLRRCPFIIAADTSRAFRARGLLRGGCAVTSNFETSPDFFRNGSIQISFYSERWKVLLSLLSWRQIQISTSQQPRCCMLIIVNLSSDQEFSLRKTQFLQIHAIKASLRMITHQNWPARSWYRICSYFLFVPFWFGGKCSAETP